MAKPHPYGQPAAPAHHDSVGGFISNLAHGVGSALVGLGEAPVYLGEAAYHDIAHSDQPSQLYSMLKGIGSQYKNFYYEPLAHGNFGKFAQNLYDNPVQPAMDILTAVTGGAGAVGKAGELAAIGGEAGSTAARIGESVAGLRRVSAEDFAKLPVAEQVTAKLAKNGDRLLPKAYEIKGSTGSVLHVKPGGVARNPAVRARALVKEAALAKINPESIVGKLGGSHFTPDVRGMRLETSKHERISKAALTHLAGDAAQILPRLSPPEARALFYRSLGFRDKTRLDALVAHRTNRIAELEDAARAQGGRLPKRGARAILNLKSDLATITDKDVAQHIVNPTAEMRVAEQKINDLSNQIQPIRGARDAAGSKEFGGSGMGDVEARAMQPLRVIHGDEYQLPDGEDLPSIISFSQNHKPATSTGAVGKTIAGSMKTGEDLQSTGTAFRDALYKPDVRRIFKTASSELEHVGALVRLKYIANAAVAYDPTDPAQAEALTNGALKLVKPGSSLASQLGELSRFVSQRLEPIAQAAGDADTGEISSLVAQWASEVDGQGLVVPAATLREMTKQVSESYGVLKTLLRTPTRVWRDLTLSLKGSFYVNNFLGNLLMGLLSYGPQYLGHLLLAGSSHSKRGRLIDEAIPAIKGHGALGTLRDQSIADMRSGGAKHPVLAQLNPLTAISRLGDAFAGVGAKFTEDNFRRAAASVEFHKAARQLADAAGIPRAEAFQRIANDADAVDHLAETVYGDMLDYSKMTPFERDTVRVYLPFWNFSRAIFGRTLRMTLDEPWKVKLMAVMSQWALDHNQKNMFAEVQGAIPSYLTGLLQVGKTKNGLTPVYSTYAANPFSNIADEAEQVNELFNSDPSGEAQSPFAQFNPYIRSAIEAGVGKNLFTGQQLTGSRIGIGASQLASNFPQAGLYESLRYPKQTSDETHTFGQRLEQYAGVPLGTFSAPNTNTNNAIAAYYAAKDAAAKKKHDAKHAALDQGRLLGLGHLVGLSG